MIITVFDDVILTLEYRWTEAKAIKSLIITSFVFY